MRILLLISLVAIGASAQNATLASPRLSPEWDAAYAKARSAISRLSLSQKVDLATGVQWARGPCVGNTPAINSIGFPGLCLHDGPLGIRFADLVSAFPAAINAAATFSRDLLRQRAVAMGEEFRGKGINVALAPAVNMARIAAAGRNWETFGGDPWLQAEAAYETIMGIQSQGVQAAIKHYILNEQEHFRESSSSILDERTLMEIYALPFLRSMHANVASVMCSYNQINGTYACENDYILNQLLKGEFGFPGFVTSDWWATHSTSPSVNGGLDMTMPGDKTYESGTTWFGPELVNAVNRGQVSRARIDDMAVRILAPWYLLKQDSGYPAPNFDSWNPNLGQHVDVQGNHKELIRTIGAASTVLLKNTNGALPLQRPASLAIIGSGARDASSGNPNYYADRAGNDGVLAMGWGSGTVEFPYLISPNTAISARASRDGTSLTKYMEDYDLNAAARAAQGKSAALVFITADSGEGYLSVEGHDGDRNDLNAWHNGNALVNQVARYNNNTIVIVNTVGQIDMEQWIDNPNVSAVVWSGLPGQEAGNSLVDILYGDYNPSGRLPYTIAKNEGDYSARLITSGSGIVPIRYTEGLNVDYRHFDAQNITPRFEFGFGLSYTTFEYAGLSVSGSPDAGSSFSSRDDADLFKKVMKVTFTVSNVGGVDGSEVPQLYLSLPSAARAAPKNLKGFDNVFIPAGSSKEITLELTNHDFSYWDTSSRSWRIPSGQATVRVGASSRLIKLTESVSY